MISNPLVASQQLNINNINIINKEYYNIYILTLKKNITKIDESIYSYYIDRQLYDDISNNLILIKAPLALIKNFSHYTKINILSKYVIEKFNINCYYLHENNLVLFIFNISYQNIKLYLLQYEKINTLIDIYKTLSVNKYFNIDFQNNIILENLKKNILNINESNYWINKFNCLPNLSQSFEKRKLHYKYLKNINADFENYLNSAYKKKNYCDPIRMLLINEYKYKMNTNNIFTKEEILNLLLMLPEREQFLLLCNLIISKNYCHLILNNKETLILIKTKFLNFIQLFRYLIGYAWIRFYFEESIKKNYITIDNQFIFEIDTAAELPLFPFSMNNPKMNPYCPILVNDTSLNSEYNIGGIFDYKDSLLINHSKLLKNYKIFHNNGICNLEQFKKNVNIFLTGDENKNILQNIEWKKLDIALGGSVLCACIQKHNPLIDLFCNFLEKDRLKRYYNEYYGNSDIDIMFLGNDVIDFMNRVKIFYDQVVINVCNLDSYAIKSNIKLECNKFIYLFVSENDIHQIITKNPELLYDNIINNLETLEIKNLFLDLLNTQLEKYKKIFFSRLSEEQFELYKEKYNDYINFDNLDFRIRLSKNTNENVENYETNIGVTYKYKISSPYLQYPFELFMIKYSFMSIVQNFHLPCVRCYYDGSNVFLTPSCISAHLTYMNLDYKYFAGTKNPSEIINKYRMRGFGTWLNEDEKIILLKYSSENENWNNLYGININNEKSLINNLGSLKLYHKIFRPRLYNPDEFINSQPIDIQKGYYNISNLVTDHFKTKYEYINEITERYNILHVKTNKYLQYIFENLQCINENGSINPIEKWVIESSWNVSLFKNPSNTNVKPLKMNILIK